MAQGTYDTYRRNNQTFYCTHGHPQCFTKGKSEAQKLQEQLDADRIARQRAEQRVAQVADEMRERLEAARNDAAFQKHRANGYKGHATRITKRAKAGVCPCCNRHFAALERHMATKHPNFTPIEINQVAQDQAV